MLLLALVYCVDIDKSIYCMALKPLLIERALKTRILTVLLEYEMNYIVLYYHSVAQK